MGEHHISISLGDEKSIEEAKKAIEEYIKSIDVKKRKLTRTLSKIGVERAQMEFDAGHSEYEDGTTGTIVSSRQTEDGFSVEAAVGEATLFVEFGAGATYGYGDDPSYAAQFGFGPGTYNPESPNWNNPDGWDYPGGHTLGNPPAMAMKKARDEMVEKAMEEARKVFE